MVRFHGGDWPVAARGKLIEAKQFNCILSAAPIHPPELGVEHAPAVRGESVIGHPVDDRGDRVGIDPVVIPVNHEGQVSRREAGCGWRAVPRRAGIELEVRKERLATISACPDGLPRCRKRSRSSDTNARPRALGMA